MPAAESGPPEIQVFHVLPGLSLETSAHYHFFLTITGYCLTSVHGETHIPFTIYQVQEKQCLVLAFSAMLGQLDQGFHSVD